MAKRLRETTYSRHWNMLAFILDSKMGRTLQQIQKQLADAGFEVGERTVRRDIIALRNAGFPINEEKSHGTPRYKMAESFSPSLPVIFNPLDFVSVLAARAVLESRGNSSLALQLDGLLRRLRKQCSRPQEKLIAQLEQSIYARPVHGGQAPGVPAKTFDTLAAAIDRREKVRVAYRNALGKLSTGRLLAPMHLYFDKDLAYLIAYCFEKSQVRTFALPRFVSVELTALGFEQTWEFDLAKFSRESYSMFQSTPEDVELEFQSVLEPYFEMHPIHSSQRMSKVRGRPRLSFRSWVNDSLVHQLTGFGGLVEILKPARLRELVIERHRQGLRRYDPESQPGADAVLPLEFE